MTRSAFTTDHPTRGWAPGLALFAGLMMIIIGVYQMIVGVAALVQDQFYVVVRNLADPKPRKDTVAA